MAFSRNKLHGVHPLLNIFKHRKVHLFKPMLLSYVSYLPVSVLVIIIVSITYKQLYHKCRSIKHIPRNVDLVASTNMPNIIRGRFLFLFLQK